MSNLAESYSQQWTANITNASLPTINIDSFNGFVKERNGQYTAKYKDLTLLTAIQPIYSIDHQRSIGFEALIRANDSSNKPLSPLELFDIPKTEADSIYLDRLCRYIHAANFQKLSNENNWLFLNVSAQTSIKGRHYGLFFSDLLKKYNINPSNVVVEIIEDPATDNEKLQEAADYYKSIGCLLAIDDFGAGHSNFERVWSLKPDIVKLDRSLLLNATYSTRNSNILTSIVNLLHQAGCLVVVEGVETAQQALIASQSGADFVQGYYFSMPLIHFKPEVDKSMLFTQLAQTFVQNEQKKSQDEQSYLSCYRYAFQQTIEALQQGSDFIKAGSPLKVLEKSIRYFLLNDIGEQVYPTETLKVNSDNNNSKFQQLKTAAKANWYRKHYVQSALKNANRICISKPYRSITGDGLCVTLSMTFKIKNQPHILCVDIEPPQDH